MKSTCALCGRPTMPFVVIGREAIGPKCAKRAGLTPTRSPKGSRVRFVRVKAAPAERGETLDLFAEVAA